MGAEIVTFGCRLNAVESDLIAGLAQDAGLSDTVIVNTCAVTSEAERQARQAIRRLRRERPDAAIIVTGCAAQINPARFAAMPEVSRVVGNLEKLKAETWKSLFVAPVAALEGPQHSASLAATPRVQVGDIMQARRVSAENLPVPLSLAPVGRLEDAQRSASHTRAFVEVQQGCDHRCTFCIIPYGRGPSRSAAPADVIARLRQHVARGAAEAVLTGVDLTSWGDDLPGRPSLAQLVRQILDGVPELSRLRLSSLDPAEIGDDLLDLFARETRLMPHLHLSLQAGDDLILKRMKRRHSRAQALEVIAQARRMRPEMAFGADLIAGFPTENEDMFARTLALIDEAGLDLVHVFPFSPREGTPAARMPQVSGPVVQARAAALRDAAKVAEARFLARQIGEVTRVLVERSGKRGHAENFAAVTLAAAAAPGSIVSARVTGVAGGHLLAA